MVTVRDAREEEEIMKYVGVHDVQLGKGRVRKSFASIDEVVEMPDLIEVQKNSYERFLKEAERLLYGEFAHVLHLEPSQVPPYILKELRAAGAIS